MRRILCLFICVLMLLCWAMPCTTFADGENSTKVYENIDFLSDGSVRYSEQKLFDGAF